MTQFSQPEIIAHRGLHETAHENTMASFDLAASAGAAAIELDVHSTADGVIVVHHDFEIAASGSLLAISNSTYQQAKDAAAANSFELPVLSDVLNRFSGLLKVYIEVKAPAIELAVARVVRSSQCELAVHSFDHRVVKAIRDFVPGLQTGVLTVGRPVDPVSLMRAADATDYWPQADFVDRELVDYVHASGGRIVVWTANRPEQWDRLTRLGVDGICTDRPDHLRDWLKSK